MEIEPEVTLKGVERYTFRLEIDAASGALERAVTTADNLDLAVSMPDVPTDKMPHIAISREVAIEMRSVGDPGPGKANHNERLGLLGLVSVDDFHARIGSREGAQLL